MIKIMQLSTYPIKQPLHGGQIRVSEIRKYLESKNCQVKSLSLSELSHSNFTSDDFLIDEKSFADFKIPYCRDYQTSLICTEGEAFKFLTKKILAFNPNIIFLEQPWIWPAIKKLRLNGILNKDIKIIYSSHNIEYEIKKSLLETNQIEPSLFNPIISNIYELERNLCKNADFALACTYNDAEKLKKLGASNVLICGNGINVNTINTSISDQLVKNLQKRKYALFIGSAYPPNAIGFWNMLGNSLAWLPPETFILVVGGVSKILDEYYPSTDPVFSLVVQNKIKKLGFVSNEFLSSLIDKANVILLPITIGGGSNLKTAEAILSQRPTVATFTAIRGYEFVESLSNFLITDNQSDFINTTYKFLTSNEHFQISDDEKALRQTVIWKNTLKELDIILQRFKEQ